MARKPRIEFPGALYHVIARGNQRRKTFLDRSDYEDYLDRLRKYHEKFSFVLYAYCLMPNHLHLLMETADQPLSKIMQAVQFSYTQSFNRRHKKVGHLFQGRYKAILCDKDEYLLQLIRYIHLNPVRAKIVTDPKDYLWSSHRTLIGMDQNPHCDAGAVWGLFSRRRREAMRLYASFVGDAIVEGHRNEFYQLKDQRVLGEDDYVQEIISGEEEHKQLLRFYDVPMEEIVSAVAKDLDIPLAVIRSPSRGRLGSFARGVIAHVAKRIAGISMKEVGRVFGKSEGAIALSHRTLVAKMAGNAKLEDCINRLCETLIKNHHTIKY